MEQNKKREDGVGSEPFKRRWEWYWNLFLIHCYLLVFDFQFKDSSSNKSYIHSRVKQRQTLPSDWFTRSSFRIICDLRNRGENKRRNSDNISASADVNVLTGCFLLFARYCSANALRSSLSLIPHFFILDVICSLGLNMFLFFLLLLLESCWNTKQRNKLSWQFVSIAGIGLGNGNMTVFRVDIVVGHRKQVILSLVLFVSKTNKTWVKSVSLIYFVPSDQQRRVRCQN